MIRFALLCWLAWSGAAVAASAGADVAASTVVRQFYELAVNGHDPAKAFARYAAPDYVEHSGDVAQGTRSSSLALMQSFVAKWPAGHADVLRTATQAGLVFLHVRFRPGDGTASFALAEIFRVEQGMITEHWDVIAPLRSPPINPISPF